MSKGSAPNTANHLGMLPMSCGSLLSFAQLSPILLFLISYSFNLFFMLVTYMLPWLIMFYCYSKMCFSLWNTSIIGNYSDALAQAQKDKKKVVKMFVFIFLMFCIDPIFWPPSYRSPLFHS